MIGRPIAPAGVRAPAAGNDPVASPAAGRLTPTRVACDSADAPRKRALRVCGLAVALALAGCAAPRSYVALLANEDGSTGKVTYAGLQGSAQLSQPLQAAPLQGRPATFMVSEQQLQRDAGAAIAAQPRPPRVFVVYFEPGDTQITAASLALLPVVLEEVRSRPGADLAIIGHTDTQGQAAQNAELSVRRAQQVAELLKDAIATAASTEISSHGERNLLVLTPDETNEPRNRRVEITVR